MAGIGIQIGVGQRQKAVASGVGPVTDPALTAIRADGWSADYSSPPIFDPVANPKYLVLSRQGFNIAGGATNYNQALVLTQRVRQAYPNQGSLDASRVALTDYVYSTETIIGLATNNSTEISPKPVANLVLPDRRVVGNTLRLELVAFHRNARNREQIACVEFRATDGTNTVTQIVSVSSVLGHPGDVNPVIGYACDLDISSLINGPVTANAKVFPWIGGAASVLDSAASSVARDFSPQVYLKNPTLAASPVFAYVNASTGNDTTGAVSATAATAEAAPCLTIVGALNRIIAVNGSVDGCVIRLMAGTHVFGSTVATRTQNIGEIMITRDPNATRANAILTFGAASARPRLGAAGGWLRIRDVSISRTGTGTMLGEAASQLRVWFDQVNFDNASAAATMYSNSHGAWTGAAISNPTNSFTGAAAGGEHRMWRGISGASFAACRLEGWLVLGCTLPQTLGFNTAAVRSLSGSIIAFGRYTSLDLTGGFLPHGASADFSGAAFVQNIVEYTSTVTSTALTVSADGATGSNVHMVLHHNTYAGAFIAGRSNLFYEDGATARTSRLHSCVGNIHVQINTKGDWFVTDGSRVGNWAYLYGVGCRGEFSQYIDADSGGLGTAFAQAYPGLNASIGASNSVRSNPQFVAYAGTTYNGTTYTAGAGNGNYALQAGSPAKARVADPVLRFDFAGASRAASNDAAGAYA